MRNDPGELSASTLQGQVVNIKCLTIMGSVFTLPPMNQDPTSQIARRRAIEDELLALGAQRQRLAQDDGWNRERIRKLVGPARAAGIKVRDVARMTGLSTQTLHAWMMDLMRPIPDIHLALTGPAPTTLEQAVLRTIGEEPPTHEWRAGEVLPRIPDGWPTGTVEDIDAALERLVQWHMIWDGEDGGYCVGAPDELANPAT